MGVLLFLLLFRRLLDPHQKLRHQFDRLLRGRQPDALQRVLAKRLQPLQRQRQMAAALAACHGVDFVDDDGAGAAQHRASGVRAEQHVQRFRRGHEDVRGEPAHRGAFVLRGVAGAHCGADLHVRQATTRQFHADAFERGVQIDADVVRQSLQRRDVDDLGQIGEFAELALPDEIVDRGEEGGKGLARTRGCGHQHMPAGLDCRPCLRLRRGGRGKRRGEPRGDGGMEACEGHGSDTVAGVARVVRDSNAGVSQWLRRYRWHGWGV